VDLFHPRVDLAFGLIPGHAVALLDPTREFGPFALHELDIVVGELAPLLARFSFELFPIAFDSIPIHRLLLLDSAISLMLRRKIRRRIARSGGSTWRRKNCSNPLKSRKQCGRSRQLAPAAPQLGRPGVGGGWVAGLQGITRGRAPGFRDRAARNPGTYRAAAR
jgi:hypothetical protein